MSDTSTTTTDPGPPTSFDVELPGLPGPAPVAGSDDGPALQAVLTDLQAITDFDVSAAISAVEAVIADLPPQGVGDLTVTIKSAQLLLSANFGQPIPTTGVFDDDTALAVKAAQTTAGLPVTGEVDGATWLALITG
jgi:peptidoglycan hydrolase-like protein with peptidoglycan-binding domain